MQAVHIPKSNQSMEKRYEASSRCDTNLDYLLLRTKLWDPSSLPGLPALPGLQPTPGVAGIVLIIWPIGDDVPMPVDFEAQLELIDKISQDDKAHYIPRYLLRYLGTAPATPAPQRSG